MKIDKLTEAEILDAVAYEAGLSPDLVRPIMKVALDTLVQYIGDAIMYGERLDIPGLGQFYVSHQRVARHVGSKERYESMPVVRFRPADVLRLRVRDYDKFERETAKSDAPRKKAKG